MTPYRRTTILWTKLLVCAALTVLVSCGGKSAPSTTPDDPGAGDSSATATGEQAIDISDWAQWTQINPEPVRSAGHDDQWVTVYVSNEHADDYRALSSTMPNGMKVAKVLYQDNDGTAGDAAAIVVMVKMEPGYDAEGGDWYYGVYDATGQNAEMHGKLDTCKGCHESYADTDYLGGMPK